MRLIVGITGATGAVFGVRALQILKDSGIETHLVLSKWGARTLLHETPHTVDYVRSLADRCYADADQGAAISSGSFVTDGMLVAPCSVRTLAAIAHGHGDNLVHRAADVILKERRKLVLMVRETPFSDIHLENMLKLSRMGVVIMPPMPAFYTNPQSLDDVINHTVMRALDQFGIHLDAAGRWGEEPAAKTTEGT
ncbi:MAG TPA: UbiX family flavin prenyltransferase [Terriglobia bacterium]|nr:UbiX family flavin prenyltransferase [Terriglobia bacterium]